MATIAEPNVVIDGLVFSLDAANSRCYSGSGITFNGLVSGTGGTLVNGVGFTSTNQGSFILDGTNDWINVPSNPVFAFNNFTMSAWFKSSDKSRYNDVISRYSLGIVTVLIYSDITTGRFVFSVGGNTLTDTSSDIVNGFWNYVTARRSSGNLEVFINGIRSNFIVSTSNGFIDADRWRIGTTNASEDFANCNISQVQFYNRSLTAQEILQNYNATKSRYGY
jgi:hypothetical protein